EISLGREPDNQFCLSDQAISRRHCLFTVADGEVTLTDLDSRNGTFVNGLPIKQRVLEHGDTIRLGDHHFLFHLHEAESVSALAEVQFEEADVLSGATRLLKPDEAFYGQP